MIKSKEVTVIRELFYILGRDDKLKLLKYSNLTNRERQIMTMRFIVGLSTKETAEKLNMDIDTFNQAQKKIYVKLYSWIEIQYQCYQLKQQ